MLLGFIITSKVDIVMLTLIFTYLASSIDYPVFFYYNFALLPFNHLMKIFTKYYLSDPKVPGMDTKNFACEKLKDCCQMSAYNWAAERLNSWNAVCSQSL